MLTCWLWSRSVVQIPGKPARSLPAASRLTLDTGRPRWRASCMELAVASSRVRVARQTVLSAWTGLLCGSASRHWL